MYGRISGGGGQLYFQLDGGSTFVPLNNTNLDDGTTLVWNSGNFGDGDHQLFWLVNTLVPNATVVLDYLEYVLPLLHFFLQELGVNSFAASGLKIRQDWALIPYGRGQTPRMYPKKRPSWTVPALILFSPTPLSGLVTTSLTATDTASGPRANLVLR